MNINFKTFLHITLILGLSFSCAGNNKRTAKYDISSETDKTFDNIEKESALETYRLMRLRDLQENRRKTFKKRRYKKIKPKRITHSEKPAPAPRPKPISQDSLMEIRQNLTYFCMKNRKHPKFEDKDLCRTHAEATFKECEGRYKSNPNMNIVNCVKNKLNL